MVDLPRGMIAGGGHFIFPGRTYTFINYGHSLHRKRVTFIREAWLAGCRWAVVEDEEGQSYHVKAHTLYSLPTPSPVAEQAPYQGC